jgi:hypothetical protein
MIDRVGRLEPAGDRGCEHPLTYLDGADGGGRYRTILATTSTARSKTAELRPKRRG